MVKNIINSVFSGPAYDKYSDERTRAYTESPTTFDYNIDANKAAGQFVADRTQELLGNNAISKGLGILGQAAAVPVGFYSSFAHEAAQAKDRMQPGSGAKGFYDAFMAENPLSTAAQRAGGILSSIPGIGDAVYNMGAKAYDVLNSPMGTAQAAEVTPTGQRINALGELEVDADRFLPGGDLYTGISTFKEAPETYVGGKPADVFTGGRPSMADIAGEINENLRDLGNPTGDPRIASEEQGLSGFPGIGPNAMGTVDPGFQNVLDAREARRNEIAMQQNPDYGQFFDAAPVNEPKRGIASIFGKVLGPALTLAGFPTPGKLVSAYNTVKSLQGGALGNAVSRARTGLGSLSRKMRGVNPDGTTRTQSQYEAARDARRTQGRIDSMLARKAAGKSYSEKNLQEQIGKQIAGRADKSGKGRKGGFTNPGRGSYGPHRGGGGNSGGGGGKIVCTMMNDSYGFGNFRNKIWLKHSRDLPKEYEVGYHTIFLPLVKFAKGKGKLNKTVKKTLEHIARHRTYDLKQEMKGKTHLLGRAYRKVLEPICFITGKIKSALGRG